MAQPFDPKRLAMTSEAVPVAEQIQRVLASRSVGVFSVSNNGMLAYRAGVGAGGFFLTWFDRSGKREGTLGEPANVLDEFHLSADGKSLAAGIEQTPSRTDIWIYDIGRGLRTRLTFDPAIDTTPIWSPDGRSIVFASNQNGHSDLYRKSVDGAGSEELLFADDHDKYPTSWSPDGRSILFYEIAGASTLRDLFVLPLFGEHKPIPFLITKFNEQYGQFSPDGKWVAYASDESGRYEIYVVPFPGPGGKRQISIAGGNLPRWRRDGKVLFYVGANRRLMAAEIEDKGGALEVGRVLPLVDVAQSANAFYDVSADGQHFLMRAASENKAGDRLTLVQNWTAGLKK